MFARGARRWGAGVGANLTIVDRGGARESEYCTSRLVVNTSELTHSSLGGWHMAH